MIKSPLFLFVDLLCTYVNSPDSRIMLQLWDRSIITPLLAVLNSLICRCCCTGIGWKVHYLRPNPVAKRGKPPVSSSRLFFCLPLYFATLTRFLPPLPDSLLPRKLITFCLSAISKSEFSIINFFPQISPCPLTLLRRVTRSVVTPLTELLISRM